jgi:hypothetical protein
VAADPQPGPSGPAPSREPADQPPPSWDDPSEGWDDGLDDENDSFSAPGPAVSGDLRTGSPGMAGARPGLQERPSGIDLIARELGGRIVEGLDASGSPLA